MEMRTVPLLAFAAELLALDAYQLDERIQHEVSNNPALKVTRRSQQCGDRRARPAREDRARPSARAELLTEAMAAAPRTSRHAVEAVVASLNRHGLLTHTSPGEIRSLAGCTADELEHGLSAVRDVGPAGIACFDARACLLAQMESAVNEERQPDWALARRMVEAHLPDVANGDLDAIAKTLGVEVDAVESAINLIRRHLTPYPDIDLSDDYPGPGAAPDIVFHLVDDAVAVEINDPWQGRIRISPEFNRAAAGEEDLEVRSFMRQQVTRARLFIAALDRRRATVERVAAAVAAHHLEALTRGSTMYRPLRRRDVAAALEVHESTVSRAVKDRTVQLPDGRTVPLATLFGGGHHLETVLARLMATERKCSDQQLSDMLRAEGIHVARRTVAKYRRQLVSS
jgi:RNA polymerase sigma-54 factor